MRRLRTGRKPDWFREKCAEYINQENLLDFVLSVAKGTAQEERIVKIAEGTVQRMMVTACIKDRISAVEFFANYGYGKPAMFVLPIRTPEDSKRTADEFFNRVTKLEQDALNRFRENRAIA